MHNFTPRKREELLEKSRALEREGKREQAWKLKGQAVEVSYEHISGFIEVQQSFILFLVIHNFKEYVRRVVMF